jgi:hypothetical protein
MMIVPVIHDRGTPRDELVARWATVSRGLGEAIISAWAARPSPSDYSWTIGKDLYEAEKQHQELVSRLEAIRDEVRDFAVAIEEAPVMVWSEGAGVRRLVDKD